MFAQERLLRQDGDNGECQVPLLGQRLFQECYRFRPPTTSLIRIGGSHRFKLGLYVSTLTTTIVVFDIETRFS